MTNSRNYYERLAESADLYDNLTLTKDPKCPPDILDRFSEDMYFKIMYNVAENPNTSVETLTKIYNNGNRCVKVLVICNESCPLNILECEAFISCNMVASSKASPSNLKHSILGYLWLAY
jgi:hypothetical protein